MMGAVLGFFASSWFGWALDDPPARWRKGLVAGCVVSLATAVTGALLAARHWSDGSVFDAATSRTFGIVVGIEVALAALGAWLLSRRRRSELVSAYISLVVGVHFFALAPLLQNPLLYVVAVVMTIGAVASIPIARGRSISVSSVAGVLAGSTLLAAAIFALVAVVSGYSDLTRPFCEDYVGPRPT